MADYGNWQCISLHPFRSGKEWYRNRQQGGRLPIGPLRRPAVIDAFRAGAADISIRAGAAVLAGSGVDPRFDDGARGAHGGLLRRFGEFGELVAVERAHGGRIVERQKWGELAQIDVFGAKQPPPPGLEERIVAGYRPNLAKDPLDGEQGEGDLQALAALHLIVVRRSIEAIVEDQGALPGSVVVHAVYCASERDRRPSVRAGEQQRFGAGEGVLQVVARDGSKIVSLLQRSLRRETILLPSRATTCKT